jgi:hypothetical protein
VNSRNIKTAVSVDGALAWENEYVGDAETAQRIHGVRNYAGGGSNELIARALRDVLKRCFSHVTDDE